MTWCFFQTVALFVGLVCIFIELMHYYCVWCFQERTRQRTQDTRQCCVTPMVAGGPQIGGASPCELSSGITRGSALILSFSTQCIIVTLDCDLSNTPNDGQATGPVHRPHLASADRLIFMEGFSSKHWALIGQMIRGWDCDWSVSAPRPHLCWQTDMHNWWNRASSAHTAQHHAGCKNKVWR